MLSALLRLFAQSVPKKWLTHQKLRPLLNADSMEMEAAAHLSHQLESLQ